MPLTARGLINDWAAAVAQCQAPVISIEVTKLDPYTTTISLHDAIDAKFLALIDDLVEMHPAGLRRRTPLRAAPREPFDWEGRIVTNDRPVHLTRQPVGP